MVTAKNTTSGKGKRIAVIILKTVLWIAAIPPFLLLVVFIVLQFPQVQHYATEKATAYLSGKIKTKVQLGALSIDFPKSISLTDVYVEDEASDTLFYGHKITVDLNFSDLISRKITLNAIELENVTGHIYRGGPGDQFNFSFIAAAFSKNEKDTLPEKKDESPGWDFSIKTISLRQIYFTYHDRQGGTQADLHLGTFETHIDKFDLDKKIIHLGTINLDDTRVLVLQEQPLVESKDTTAPAPFDYVLALDKLGLKNIQAVYKNQVGGQDLDLQLGKLLVDIKNTDLQKEKIDIRSVLLHGTKISYTQNKILLKNTAGTADLEREPGKVPGWIVTLGKLDLDSNTLAYTNNNSAALNTSLDFNHLLAKNISLQGKDLYASAKKIDFHLTDFHFTEQSGFVLKKFRADISYDSTHAALDKLDLQVNDSRITKHLELTYPSLSALKDSLSLLGITSDFKNTRISLKDVLYFSPDLLQKLPLKPETQNAAVSISGKINGTLKDLKFSKLEIKTKENTAVMLDGNISNITDSKNLYASVSFNIKSSKKDITGLLADSLIPENITIPETLAVKGNYTGYLKNFDSDLEIATSFGKIKAGVKMNPRAGNTEQPYSGNVTVINFDVGKLLNQSQSIGAVTMSASVKGSGFDTSNLNAAVNLEVIKAVLKNYEYRNFNLQGSLQKKSFTGKASIHDENLAFDFNGGVDLEPSHPKYTFTLNLTGADLKALNLSENDLRVSALIQSDIGNEPGRNATGTASIRNALIIRNGRKYPVDSIVVVSAFKDGISDLQLRSEIMTADFNGNITVKELPALLKQHLNSYFDMQSEIPDETLSQQKFTFALTVTDPGIITSNFVPQLERLTPVAIKGSYDSEAKNIRLSVDVPQIKYDGVTVDSLKFDITSNAQKLNYELHLAEVSNPTLRFENVSLNGELKNNSLSFHLNTAKDDSVKLLVLGGVIKSLDKDFELKLDPELVLNSEKWTVDRTNYLHFGKDGLYANNLTLSNGPQSISVNSKEKIPGSPLALNFKNFEITTVSRLMENKKELVRGNINGNVVLEKQNNAPAFTSDLVIKDFIFQSVPVGTIKLKASNVEDPQKYNVDLSIEGNGNDIALRGFYRASKTSDLDLLLDIRHLNLASVEPFTFKHVSRMSGSVNGKLNLKGPVSLPAVEGSLNFKDAAFKPKILDSYLTVHDSKIIFAQKKIQFDNFMLHDSLEHTASLNGTIDLHDLKTIELDLRLKTDEFLALNTTPGDNPLYYGKIIIDSDIRISGTTDAPTLDIKAKLNKGSTITYVKPESQVSKNESKGVVEFINPASQDISIMARQNDSIDGLSKMKGIELNASINVDKSVQLKMIVDKSTGDSLYVQGGGLLDFGLDRSGKTSLAGKYNIVDGGYFLSLENLVKRSFKIQKGSAITWSGDMLDPYIDLTAVYSIKTSPLDLVQNELAGVTEFEKNKYRNLLTFMVYLKMTGFISTPEISFDIQLASGDRGALNGAVNSKLAQLREDETQLNKQVFALLTLRRFVGENPLESSSDGGLSSASRSSASKVLTQQLSSLSEKYVNFVDLDLGVNSFEDYSSGQEQGRTQLQVGVSKQLFNEKVTVRVGGNVDLEGERATQNTANDVAGNINIDYRLTEDGRYKLEASRENQYENPIEGELTKTAAGVVYTRNFNTFRQLFSKSKKQDLKTKEKLKKKEQEEKDKKEKEEEINP